MRQTVSRTIKNGNCPDVTILQLWTEAFLASVRNLMLQVPLAYKYVIIAAMMSQINYYAPRMHLPIEVPFKEKDVRFLNVSPPVTSGNFQFYGGRIQVKNY